MQIWRVALKFGLKIAKTSDKKNVWGIPFIFLISLPQ